MPTTEGLHTNLGGGLWSRNQTPFLFNGVSYDPQQSNNEGILLASAARTVQATSADQLNFNARGLIAYLNVTVASGTGGLILRVESKDPVSGQYVVLNGAVTSIIATGLYGYELYPGASTAGVAGVSAINARVAGSLPRTWRIRIAVGDATSYTYSVGYAEIL